MRQQRITELDREAVNLFDLLDTSDDEDDPYVPLNEALSMPMHQLVVKDAVNCVDATDRKFLNDDELSFLDEMLADRVNNRQEFVEPPVIEVNDNDQALVEENTVLDLQKMGTLT